MTTYKCDYDLLLSYYSNCMYTFLNTKVFSFVRTTRGRRKKRKKTNNIICVKARFALEILVGGGATMRNVKNAISLRLFSTRKYVKTFVTKPLVSYPSTG